MNRTSSLARTRLRFHVAACLLCYAWAAAGDCPAAEHLPPVLVGGHAHGAENIQALANLGLGNFVWIPKQGYALGNTSWNDEHDVLADARACAECGLYFMISQRRGLGPDFKPGGEAHGGDTTPEIHGPDVIARLKDIAGQKFVGLHHEELDADFLQGALRPSYRSRLPHLYDFSDRAGGRARFETELIRIREHHRRIAPGIGFWPNLCMTYQHSGFRIGADLVLGELLESLPTVHLQLAYLRGGSHQFQIPWGVWISPWYWGSVPCEDKELWPHPVARIGEGQPASALRRSLFLAFASGARVLTVQETEPLFKHAVDGPGYELAAWGRELQRFWQLVQQTKPPMTPLVNTAVMVDQDCGWAPGPLHGEWIPRDTVWGKLPPTRDDETLATYLDTLLPGYGRREPGWWRRKGNFFPGYFTATPAGPFDIVASDVSAARLRAYRCVIALGTLTMTPDLLENLKAYVHSGGVLHLNVNQMRNREAFVQAPEFLGTAVGMSSTWSEWSQGNLLMRGLARANVTVCRQPIGPWPAGTRFEEPPFLVQDVQPTTARVLADDGASRPVLLENTYGNGTVRLSTVDGLRGAFLDDEGSLKLLREAFLSDARSPALHITPAHEDARQAGLSWILARDAAETRWLFVANHSAQQQTARVEWGDSQTRLVDQEGNTLERQPQNDGSSRILVAIPPEQVVILQIRP